MPYVTCPTCHVSAYSAARWSTREPCPRCGTPLDAPPRAPAYRADTGLVSALTQGIGLVMGVRAENHKRES